MEPIQRQNKSGIFTLLKFSMVIWTILCVVFLVSLISEIEEEKSKAFLQQRMDLAFTSKDVLIQQAVVRVGVVWFGGMVLLGIFTLIAKPSRT